MPKTTTYTADDLARLDAAIASSELEIERNGSRVRFRTMDELIAARAVVADSIAAAAVSAPRPGPRRFHFTTTRGD